MVFDAFSVSLGVDPGIQQQDLLQVASRATFHAAATPPSALAMLRARCA